MRQVRQASFSVRDGLAWLLILTAGAIWGLGAVRTLAYELNCGFCYGMLGALAGALLGSAGALVLGSRLARGSSVIAVAPQFLPLCLPLFDLMRTIHQPWRGPILLLGAPLVMLFTQISLSKWAWLGGAVLLPLLVYLPDLSPYVGRADTFEFQVIGPHLGIAHPSGYPLYTLICKLFSWIPLGSIAWRINLSAAVFAALAAGFLYLALVEGRGSGERNWHHPLALGAALTLAFSPTLWSRSIEAEVYSLNACLVALALWLAVRWHSGRLEDHRALPAFGLLIGVGISSHLTLGALGLLVVAGLVVRRLRPQLRVWALSVGLGVLGLLFYAYIPLRWPAVTGGEVMSWTEFWRFVTNAESVGALRPLAFYQDPRRWLLVIRLLQAQVGGAGLVLALAGLARIGRHHITLAVGLVGAFAAWVWFNLSFYVADPDYSAFLIPAHVVLVFCLGYGALEIGRVLRRRQGVWQMMFVTLFLLLPLSRLWQTGPDLDTIAEGRADEAWGRYVLQLPLARDATVLADSEKFPPLYYLQQIEGVRRDLEMVTHFSEAQYRDALTSRLAAGQQVYLARYLPGMDEYGVSSMGPLVAVAPPSLSGTSPLSGMPFGDVMWLTGYTLERDPLGLPQHHLTLTWHVLDAMDDDLEVRLRLVHPLDGRPVWEARRGRPVSGYTITPAWQVGWTVDDYHALRWPDWLPSGSYTLEVGLFVRFEDRGLPVAGGERMWHPLRTVSIPQQLPGALPHRLSVLFGRHLRLVGHRLPNQVEAGSAVDLDLAWLCRSGEARSGLVEFAWTAVSQDDAVAGRTMVLHQAGHEGAELCGGAHSGAVVRRYALQAPEEPGHYRLGLGWGEDAGQEIRCHWLGRPVSTCPVGSVTVTAADAGLANFGGRILLLDASMDADGVLAGGQLRVDLRWRALREMAENYTVFVQVMGPDGRLYGQVDSWPVQGAHPTADWQSGAEIPDPYSLYVDHGGPAGEYRVIVGWYLLGDMSRLPLLGSTGAEVGDYYVVGTFSVP